MLVTFFRTLILYVVIVFGVRLMGKRQLGELQPSELVVTILISNIATLPIEEVETPLFSGLLPILSLVTFEVIISAINLHSRRMRRVFSGSPVVVIKNGEIDQKKLQELRFSIDDLMAQLRQNQIFALDEVDFAVVETTGKLSVYQKYGARPLRRAIQRLLEDPLSEQILEGRWTSGSVVDVTVSEDGEELVFNEGTGSIPAPRKRDSIARDAELLLTNYDLGHAGASSGGGSVAPAGTIAGGA